MAFRRKLGFLVPSLHAWTIRRLNVIHERRRLSGSAFAALQRRFAGDVPGRSRFFYKRFLCGTLIDPNFGRVIGRLKDDFHARTFVETGTFHGETSLAMSRHFERVFTCDVKDYRRRPEFYFADNIVYEVGSSPEFLRRHLADIRARSIFFLDAHWGPGWPLREELSIIFEHCDAPVVIIDDFDAGNGLYYAAFERRPLDFDYIAPLVPPDCRFFLNPWSNRNCGLVFLFPPGTPYGCLFADRTNYSEQAHGLWNKLGPHGLVGHMRSAPCECAS